jgi:flagellar assembly factor FliW
VGALVTDYALWIAPEDLRTLGLEEENQPVQQASLACLAILTVPAEGPITANLLAPVVVNLATSVGVQAVRADTAYSHRHAVVALQPGWRTEPPC